MTNKQNTYYSSEINKQSIQDKLNFFGGYFESQHCDLDGCDHEVGEYWVMSEEVIYCAECFEWKQNAEKEKAKLKITSLENEIYKLKNFHKIDD